MDLHATADAASRTLRAGGAARKVSSATGGLRTTAFVRPFVKEDKK